MSEKNSYPVILVPGILGYGEDKKFLHKTVPYFGLFSANVEKVIQSTGREAHTASFSRFSGVWERTCELYAQIKGGTVDYGADYAEKHNISRYGRNYPGWLPNWGEDGIKVTLIAHGFGAPVARLLTNLMAGGSAAEKAAAYDCSPLFEGGHPKAVHAVVTLAGDNDGTTLFQAINYYVPDALKKAVKKFRKDDADEYLSQTEGNIFYEAGLDGMAAWNRVLSPEPNTYYLACTGEVTEDVTDKVKAKVPDTLAYILDIDKGGYRSPFAPRMKEFFHIPDLYLPTRKAGLTAPTSALLAFFTNHLPENPTVGDEAKPNDGIINTNTSLAPSTEPVTGFSNTYSCYPGKWYQMPIENRNHYSFIGLMEKPDKFRNEVLELMDLIDRLETA